MVLNLTIFIPSLFQLCPNPDSFQEHRLFQASDGILLFSPRDSQLAPEVSLFEKEISPLVSLPAGKFLLKTSPEPLFFEKSAFSQINYLNILRY